jgi:transposase InsO family protein
LIHHAAARDWFAFIHARCARFGVKRLCRALVTDSGNYFAWVRARSKRRAQERDEQWLAQLTTVHTAQSAYGVQRVTRELQRRGVPVGRRVVARLMRAVGIAGVTRRKRRNLTKPGSGASTVPDLIRRDSSPRRCPDSSSSGISAVSRPARAGCIATVLDLCSKELIGYALAPHMRTSLAVDALKAAHRAGLVAGNAIMHTDRGGQYHSRAYRNALRRLEVRQSTSRSGSCLDGAAAESFFATIKTEIGVDSWPDRASARRDIENWIK